MSRLHLRYTAYYRDESPKATGISCFVAVDGTATRSLFEVDGIIIGLVSLRCWEPGLKDPVRHPAHAVSPISYWER
jgi:hypothetical protein